MIICLDTSTPTCRLTLVDGDWRYEAEWEAARSLAKGLLAYIQTQLEQQGRGWADIKGIVVFRGPGSFTGLRIGLTVMNALAYARQLPIVGAQGLDWQRAGIDRLYRGESDGIVLPEYGGEANITKPRK